MRNTSYYLVIGENRMARDERVVLVVPGVWESLFSEQTMELALAATDHAAAGEYIKADKVAKEAFRTS